MPEDVLNKDIVLKDLDGTQLWPLAHRDSGGYIIEETYLKNYVMKDGVRYDINPTNLMYLAESSEGNIITTITGEDITIVEAVLYGISSTSTTEPEDWYDTIPDPIPDGWYLWTKTVYANGATSYNISYKGKDGINGSPAYKYSIDSSVDSIIFDVNANRLVPSTITFNFTVATGEGTPTPFNGYYTIQTSQNGEVYVNSTSGTGTTVNYSPQSTAIKFIQCKLFASSSETDPLDVETIAVISDGLNGAAGITIRSVEEWYTLTQSETPVPDPESSEWDWVMGGAGTSLPVMTQTDKYLWNYEKVNYSNNTSFISEPVIIGAYGDTGRGIKSITNYYLATSITDPTELPEPVSETSDPEWYNTPQQISESNKYLWNYEEIIYIDDSGETIVNTDPAVIGMFSKDGTNGTDAYTVIITNENHTFPASSNGHAIASSTTGSIVAYKGYTRIATDVGTIPTVSGLTFSIAGDNTTNTTYTVTADSNLSSSGSVTIPVIVDGITFNLVFSYSLAVPGINGEDAIIYYLQPSVNAINIDQDNNYVPSLFTLKGFKQVGNNEAIAYEGTWAIESTTDFITWNYFYGQSDPDTDTLQVPLSTLSHSVVALRCNLYPSNTVFPPSGVPSITPLDTQTLLFVHEGKDSYNISFDNDTLTFAGTDTAAVPGSETTYINAYRGTTRVAATLSTQGITGKPEGMTITVNNNPGSSYPGSTITVTVSSTMTSQTGTLYIPATVDSQVFMIPLRYILTLKGTNGTDGVSPTIYSVAPSYNYILVDKNNNILPSDTVYFSAYAQTGTVKASYPSIFKLYTKPLYTGDVPENYNEYEWINPKGQIRLSGIKTNQDTKIESKWYRTTNSAQYIYYSDSNSSGSTNTTAYLSSSGGNWRFGNRTVSINPAVATVVTSVQDRTGIILNNSSAGTYNTVSNFTSTDDLKIAALGAGNVRYYYLRVYDNTTLVADLVPVERKSDHEFGFYDKVSGTFFYTPGLEITHGDLIPQQSSGQLDSEGWLLVYTSASEEENCSYFISSKNISGIKAEIYKNNALLDSESIPVIFEPQDGVSGIGINSVSVMYAIVDDLADIESSQTEWSSTMPTSVEQGKYLVVRTITDYTDPSVADTIEYAYSYESIDGLDGLDGTSVTVGTIEYRVGDSATQHPTTGWQSTVPSTQPGEYLWTRTELIEGEGSSMISRYIYSVAYQGTNGQNGQNGQSVFIRYSNNSTGNPMLPEGQIGKYIGIHVGDSAPADYTGYAPWVQLEGTNGEDGAVPTGTSIQFAQTATKVDPEDISDSDWSNTMPDPIPNYYMWTKITITYSLGNPSVIYNMAKNGQNGSNGRGISGVTEYYKATDTTSTPGDTGWTENNIPSNFNETNKYLWNYEVISYSDSSTPTTTPKAIIGVYGKDGKGISSITDWYLATNISDVNNLPTIGQSPWTTTVQTADSTHKYLWNYEVIDWTEGQDTITTPVIIGNWSKDGDTGRSVTDITEYYAASDTDEYSSELVLNWGTVISDLNPPFSEDYPYLWNYELIDFNPGPDSRTPPQVISVYGQTGPAGVGISDITEYYLANNSTTTPSKESSEWGENIPTIDKNKPYLWNYELITFTDNSTWSSEPAIISRYSTSGSQIWTSETAPSGVNNTFNISDLQGDSSASIKVGDIVFYGSNRYTITAVSPTTVNCGIVESIKGATGEAGYNNATVYIYIRSAVDSTPQVPQDTLTYTFESKTLDGGSLNNWSQTIPAADSQNNPLWLTVATASSNRPADTITSSEWQTPIRLDGIDGINGTDGVSVTGINEYYKVTDTTDTPSLANFPTGWSRSLSGLTFDQNHPYLWNTETTSYSNSTTSSPTTPVIIGTWGQDGAPGSDGNDGADGVGIEWIKEYYQITSSDSTVPSNSGLPGTLGSWTEVPGTGSTPNPVPKTTSTYKYLWNCEVLHWTNNTNTVTSPAIVGVHSEDTIVYSLVVSDDAIIRNTNVSSNRLTPSTLTVTATKQIGAAAPQSYTGGTITLTAYTAGGSTSTFSSGGTIPDKINNNDVVKIKATLNVSGTEVDSQTIPIINSGTNGQNGQNAAPVYTVWLSNENHTFPADKDGHPISGSNSTTSTIYVYKDGVRVSASNISITSGTGTSGGLTITRTSGTNNLSISVDNNASLNGSRTITIRTDSIDFPVTFSYSLAVTGATGEQGPKGDKGLDGYNQATIYLYKRADLAPSVPSNGVLTYYFATGELKNGNTVITGDTGYDGWYRKIPEDTKPCYVTSVSLVATADTVSKSVTGWAAATKLVQDGKDGDNGNKVAVVNAYQRAENAPTTPPDLAVYTFLTNGLAAKNQGGSLHGWSTTMPADDSNHYPVWMISATASSANDTDDISSTEWQPRSGNNVNPIKYVQSGTDGLPSTSYSLYVDPSSIIRNTNNSNSLSSTTFTVNAKSQTGNGALANYSGRFKIDYLNSNAEWVTTYTSGGNEYSYTYDISNRGTTGAKAFRVSLYKAGGTTTLIDQQTIPVIDTGTNATPTYNAFLGNENQTFNADSAGNISPAVTTTSKIYVYKGSSLLTPETPKTKVSNTYYTISTDSQRPSTGDGIPNGMSIWYNTSTQELNITARESNSLPLSGNVKFYVTADSQTFELTFSYSKACNGTPAYNQALVTLYRKSSSPLGNDNLPGEIINYTFSTGALLGQSSGNTGEQSSPLGHSSGRSNWYKDVPDGDDVCYITTASAISTGSSVNLTAATTNDTGAWSTPRVYIKNGVDAEPVYYVTTDNDSHIFPSLDGKAYSGSDYSTTINVKAWSGSTQVAFSSFSVISSTGSTSQNTLIWGVTDGADGKTKILTITPGTNLTTNSGTFTITGTPSGSSESFTKIFSWSLGLVGTTSYWLTSSVDAVIRNVNNSANSTARTLSPTSITFNSYSKVAGGIPSAYRGRFKLEKKSNTGVWTSITTNNESEWTYTSINTNGSRFSPSDVTILSNSTTVAGTGVTLNLNVSKNGTTSSTVTLPAGQYYLSIPVTMTTSAAATSASVQVAVYSGSSRLYTGTTQTKSTTVTSETKTATLIFTLAAQTSNISFKIYYTLQAAGRIAVNNNQPLQDETTQFRISLYETGGTTNLFDQQIISVINTGANGTNGTNAISAGITNQNETFIDTIGEDINFDANTITTITAWGLNGSSSVTPTNITVTYNGASIINSSGLLSASINGSVITITFKQGFPGNTGSSGDINSGVITIGFTVSGKSFSFPYSFSLVYEGKFPIEVYPLYYLSNSSTTTPPSPTASSEWPNIGSHAEPNIWSTTKPDYKNPQIDDNGNVSNAWYYWTCQYTKFNNNTIDLSDIILDTRLNTLSVKVSKNEFNISDLGDEISSKVSSTTYNLMLYGSEDAPGETPELIVGGLITNVSDIKQTADGISSYVGTIEEGATLGGRLDGLKESILEQTDKDISAKFNTLVNDPVSGEPIIVGGVIKMDLVPPSSENPNSYTRITLGNTKNDIQAVFTNAALNFELKPENEGESGTRLAWVDGENQEFGTTKISIGQPGSGVARWRIQATGTDDTHLTFTRHA